MSKMLSDSTNDMHVAHSSVRMELGELFSWKHISCGSELIT